MTDLQYNQLPKTIKAILNTFDFDAIQYDECSRIKKQLELNGFTCDYGLDGQIYDVERLNN
jgi:hypothetical protein